MLTGTNRTPECHLLLYDREYIKGMALIVAFFSSSSYDSEFLPFATCRAVLSLH